MLSTDALAGARNRSADTPKFDGFQMCRLLTRKTYLLAIDTSEHKTYAHRNGERTRMPTLMPVMYALAGCGHLPYVSRPMISSAPMATRIAVAVREYPSRIPNDRCALIRMPVMSKIGR